MGAKRKLACVRVLLATSVALAAIGNSLASPASGMVPGDQPAGPDPSGAQSQPASTAPAAASAEAGGLSCVVLCDGQPVAGAQLKLLGGNEGCEVINGSFRDTSYVATGPDGRFTVLPQTQDYRLVAMHQEGLACVTRDELMASGGTVELARWGQVDGRLVAGSEPASGQLVTVTHDSRGVHVSSGDVTDDQGRFVLRWVAPGNNSISQATEISDRRRRAHVLAKLGVRAGEKAQAELQASLVDKELSVPQGAWGAIFRPQEAPSALAQLEGVVVAEGGQPVARAQCRVQAGWTFVSVVNGAFEREGLTVATGPDGRFIVPPQTEDFRVVLVHERGFANVTREQLLASKGQVTLVPWGRVEGQLVIRSKPAAGEEIVVLLRKSERVHVSSTSVTDEQGHFVAERVAPGPQQVSQLVKVGDRADYVRTRSAIVKPGGTAQVKLGRVGRPIVGRLMLPENLQPLLTEEHGRSSYLSISVDSKDYRGGFFRYLPDSPDLSYRPDGTFETNEVPAGPWTLEVRLFEGNGPPVTLLQHEFVVTEMPGGSSDEPLDLGTLTFPPPSDRSSTSQASP